MFPGGTIAELRAIRPGLDFGDLTVTGALSIPSTESHVTTTGRNIVFMSSIDTDFPNCNPYDRDAPDLTITATGSVRFESSVWLAGQNGNTDFSGSSCGNCYGGDGGNLTVDAPDIFVGLGIYTDGGLAARYRLSSSLYNGCDGTESIVARSNGTASPETFTASVAPGTYHIAVSFSDDNAVSFPTPQPYTLEVR